MRNLFLPRTEAVCCINETEHKVTGTRELEGWFLLVSNGMSCPLGPSCWSAVSLSASTEEVEGKQKKEEWDSDEWMKDAVSTVRLTDRQTDRQTDKQTKLHGAESFLRS
jgi:hypothetical protein